MQLTTENSSQTIQITSEKEWQLEGEGLKPSYGSTVGQAEWYEVDKMYGAGNSMVTISLKDNEKTENNSVSLNIVGKHNRVTVLIKRIIADK